MPLKNTTDAFGFVPKIFHWAMAVIIVALLFSGFLMETMEGDPVRRDIMSWHKSFGLLILFLAAARLAWKAFNPPPEPLVSKTWEKWAAKGLHGALYAVFIALPLSGWIMSSAAGFAPQFFGLFALPGFVAKSQETAGAAREAHEILAYVIIAMVAAHIAATFKHHVIDRDATLQRMTWDGLGLATGIILMALFIAALVLPLALEEDEPSAAPQSQAASAGSEAQAGEWGIIPEESSIRVSFSVNGQTVEGAFRDFKANIRFDPDRLDQALVEATISMAGFITGDAQRDRQAQGADWFNAAAYPVSTFRSVSFEKTGDNQYLAHGYLTLCGVKKELDMPFFLDMRSGADQKKIADMRGEATLNRLDFGVGQGEWTHTDAVSGEVKIQIALKAEKL